MAGAGTGPSRPARGDAGGRRGPVPPRPPAAPTGRRPARGPRTRRRRRFRPNVLLQATLATDALEHAVREEEITRNAASNVRTGTPRPRRFEPLTADEARQFLTAVRGHRLHALFELALHTGLRKGEILGLHREDFDLDAGTAALRRIRFHDLRHIQRFQLPSSRPTGEAICIHIDISTRVIPRPTHRVQRAVTDVSACEEALVAISPGPRPSTTTARPCRTASSSPRQVTSGATCGPPPRRMPTTPSGL